MTTGLTVGSFMDHMDEIAEHDPHAPVITDTGEVIFTLAPETTTTNTNGCIAAMTVNTNRTHPISVDEIRAMFAYYNVATPRSKKATGACRNSDILIRSMDSTPRHIHAIRHTDGNVVLVTTPTDQTDTD